MENLIEDSADTACKAFHALAPAIEATACGYGTPHFVTGALALATIMFITIAFGARIAAG